MKTNKLIAALLFLFASRLYAQSEGLIAFHINRLGDPVVIAEAVTGNICDLTTSGVGVFDVTFCEEDANKYFQVGVSNDSHFVDWEIRNRSTTGFTLHLRHNGDDYDPELCVVTVDR